MKIRNGFVSNSSSSSFILIGAFLNNENIYIKETVRMCSCKIDENLNPNFCPECGKKFSFEKEKIRPELKQLNIIPLYDAYGKYFIVPLPGTMPGQGGTGVNYFRIPPNIEERKKQLKDIMEPLGLWEDCNFGIWTSFRTE